MDLIDYLIKRHMDFSFISHIFSYINEVSPLLKTHKFSEYILLYHFFFSIFYKFYFCSTSVMLKMLIQEC